MTLFKEVNPRMKRDKEIRCARTVVARVAQLLDLLEANFLQQDSVKVIRPELELLVCLTQLMRYLDGLLVRVKGLRLEDEAAVGAEAAKESSEEPDEAVVALIAVDPLCNRQSMRLVIGLEKGTSSNENARPHARIRS